jgi:hypothetical protein
VGSAIDSETRTQCPEVRAEVLKTTGLDSFLVL